MSISTLRIHFLILCAGTFLTFFGSAAFAAPTVPGTATSTNWKGDHYVNGNFTLTTTGSTDSTRTISYYKLCRSNDANLNEVRGCEVIVGYTTGPNDKSMLISGTH